MKPAPTGAQGRAGRGLGVEGCAWLSPAHSTPPSLPWTPAPVSGLPLGRLPMLLIRGSLCDFNQAAPLIAPHEAPSKASLTS